MSFNQFWFYHNIFFWHFCFGLWGMNIEYRIVPIVPSPLHLMILLLLWIIGSITNQMYSAHTYIYWNAHDTRTWTLCQVRLLFFIFTIIVTGINGSFAIAFCKKSYSHSRIEHWKDVPVWYIHIYVLSIEHLEHDKNSVSESLSTWNFGMWYG